MTFTQGLQFISAFITYPVSVAMVLSVLFPPNPSRVNYVFALFGGAVSLWSLANFLNTIDDPSFLNESQELWFQITGLTLTIFSFGIFTHLFLELKGPVARLMWFINIVAAPMAVLTTWSGQGFVSDGVDLEVKPAGLALTLAVVVGLCLNHLLIVRSGHPRRWVLQWPSLLLIVGIGANATPLIIVPIDNFLAAIATVWVGRAVLRYQLFLPFQEANTHLRSANQGLSLANTQLQTEKNNVERLNEELRKANMYKTAFLANMSHELRTPLNSVIGYSGLLLQNLYGELSEQQADRIRKISRNGKHLLTLINDVLDISKIDAGRMKIYPESMNLASLSDDLQTSVEALLADKTLEYKLEIAPDLHLVMADYTRMKQVLLNLLTNAIKFTSTGQVVLSMRNYHPQTNAEEALELAPGLQIPDGDWVLVCVRDSGIGIPAHALTSIFDEFQQVDSGPTRQFGGTGLGLPIARRFVEMHGGHIWVNSQEGQGSQFYVALPRHDASQIPNPPSDAPLILLIDDDSDTADIVGTYLRSAGYRLEWVMEAEAGIEQARLLEPAVVLVDIVLTDRSGWEVIRTLQSDPQTQKLPLVVISAADERGQAAEYGLRGYVLKPVDRDNLLFTIEGARRSTPNPTSVLVVDDDKVMRELLARQLAGFGYQCQLAASGEEALEQLRKSDRLPGVLVLDLKMSLLSGFEVLQKVRLHPRTAALPILVVTSLSLNDAEREYLQNNHAHVIFKQNLNENGLAEHIRILTA